VSCDHIVSVRPTYIARSAAARLISPDSGDETGEAQCENGHADTKCGSDPALQANVILRIYKGRRLKKTIAVPGTCTCNVKQTQSWKCTLRKGRYTLKVYATDLAGNTQSKAGSAKLTVT
jgi:hypothetical protein